MLTYPCMIKNQASKQSQTRMVAANERMAVVEEENGVHA